MTHIVCIGVTPPRLLSSCIVLLNVNGVNRLWMDNINDMHGTALDLYRGIIILGATQMQAIFPLKIITMVLKFLNIISVLVHVVLFLPLYNMVFTCILKWWNTSRELLYQGFFFLNILAYTTKPFHCSTDAAENNLWLSHITCFII